MPNCSRMQIESHWTESTGAIGYPVWGGTSGTNGASGTHGSTDLCACCGPCRNYADGEVFGIRGIEARVLHTPGHATDGVT